MKSKLESTTDYSKFELHEFNRPLRDNKVLLESMKTNGFMPAGAIHCVHNGSKKLKIIRGHHRFFYAQKLKLPVYYIIDDTEVDIFDLEGSSQQNWNLEDFVKARAKAGDKDCIAILGFQKKHSLPLGAVAALLRGNASESRGRMALKRGTYKIGDPTHALQVAKVIALCRELEIPFATHSGFVMAVSASLLIPEFDLLNFLHKLKAFSAKLRKRGRSEEYLEEIEELYNHNARATRMPIKFRAMQISRERQKAVLFGAKASTNGV